MGDNRTLRQFDGFKKAGTTQKIGRYQPGVVVQAAKKSCRIVKIPFKPEHITYKQVYSYVDISDSVVNWVCWISRKLPEQIICSTSSRNDFLLTGSRHPRRRDFTQDEIEADSHNRGFNEPILGFLGTIRIKRGRLDWIKASSNSKSSGYRFIRSMRRSIDRFKAAGVQFRPILLNASIRT